MPRELGYLVPMGNKYRNLVLQVEEVSKIDTIKYAHESRGTRTWERLSWQCPAKTENYRPLAALLTCDEPRYSSDRKLNRPKSWSGHCREEKNLFPQVSSPQCVAILTELSWINAVAAADWLGQLNTMGIPMYKYGVQVVFADTTGHNKFYTDHP
jgi:hypothetical protein